MLPHFCAAGACIHVMIIALYICQRNILIVSAFFDAVALCISSQDKCERTVVCLPHSARRFIVRFLPAGFLCPLLCVCRLASVVSWLPVRCVVVCFSAGCPQPASLRRRFSARRFVSAAPPSAAICEKAFRP